MIWFALVAACAATSVTIGWFHRNRCPSCGRRFENHDDLNHHVTVRHLS